MFACALACELDCLQVPFVGFQPVRTSEHMAAIGTFLLAQAYAALSFVRARAHRLTRRQVHALFFVTIVTVAAAVFAGVVLLTYMGYIAPWSGRFYSLWDTGYAKIHIPIIASVSEVRSRTTLPIKLFFPLLGIFYAFE